MPSRPHVGDDAVAAMPEPTPTSASFGMAVRFLVASTVPLACGGGNDTTGQTFYLYTPWYSTQTFLVGDDGVPTHTWSSELEAGQSAYLQDDGSLIRGGSINALAPQNRFVEAWEESSVSLPFNVGGIIERIGSDDELAWTIDYFSDELAPHHDVIVLPNGNLLMPVWRYTTEQEVIEAGRNPAEVGSDGLWLDSLAELRVRGPHAFDVVWEWRTSDHLVQDWDPSKKNFGSVADNPQLINLNYVNLSMPRSRISSSPGSSSATKSRRTSSPSWRA